MLKNLKLGTNKLELSFKLLLKNIFPMKQYPPRNRPEIDADLAQNEMQLYLIPSRQLNISYANVYTCQGAILSNDTQIIHTLSFHPHFSENVILINFYTIHDEKMQFFVIHHHKR